MNKFPKKIFYFAILAVLSLVFTFGSRKTNPKVLGVAVKFSYNGQKGTDALTLLKQRAKVEQDNSGLVVSINGRKAESSKHEFWAFYVNNKLASVGPSSYETSDSDFIIWKIDKY